MAAESPHAPEESAECRSEVAASLQLLGDALRGGPGIVGVVGLAALIVLSSHPGVASDVGWVPDDWYQFGWVALNVACLLVLPVLIIKVGLHEPLRDYGMTLGKWRVWLRHIAVYLVAVIPLIVVASRTQSFADYYPMFRPARERISLLLLWELAYGVYFFAWEFFFRGFLLQGLAGRMGAAAVVVQTVPFVMMHFGKPEAEVWASILAGLALGVTAYRSRSFIGCWILHWVCAATMDVLAALPNLSLR